MVFPYLPLRRSIEFSSWWLGPLQEFEGPWLSAAFEVTARRFIGGFRDVNGERIERPALLARVQGGADGRPPTPQEFSAVELAVGFSTIHQNLYWTEASSHDAWRVATADNASFWVQPLDVHEGWIAFGRGGRIATTAGGHNVNDEDFTIHAPLELHLPAGVVLDDELVTAIYRTLVMPPPEHRHGVARLRVGLRWLLHSWQNTSSLTWEDRVVFAKIATEALTGEESNTKSARLLEDVFSKAADQHGGGIGTDGLLWRRDGPTFTRTWNLASGATKSAAVSEFAHWHGALSDARNAIVHGDEPTSLDYAQPGSRYEGPLAATADRIVREAITVTLGRYGFPAVWRRGISRASFRAAQRLAELDG